MTKPDHHPASEDMELLGIDYGRESYCEIHFAARQDVSCLPPTLITSFLDHAEELMMKQICKGFAIPAIAVKPHWKMDGGAPSWGEINEIISSGRVQITRSL